MLESNEYRRVVKAGPIGANEITCSRCGVQPTREADKVCGFCKALGKNVDPHVPPGTWADIRFGGVCARRFIFGLDA